MSEPELLAAYPVTLLPVRLETRWLAEDPATGKKRLGVRIYPDAISVTREGPAAVARLLPDFWRVSAWVGNSVLDSKEAKPRSEGIFVADPRRGYADQLTWLTDFDAALAAGMAVVLTFDSHLKVERLVVVGVRGPRSDRTPENEADQFAHLLRQHAASEDLGLLPPGTPTNNSDDQRTPWTDDRGPEGEVVHPVAQDPPTGVLRGEPNATTGAALSYALGVPPGTFADLQHADRTDPVQGRAMQALLFDATWGELLGWLVHPVSAKRGDWDETKDRAAKALGYARAHAENYLRGGGPLGVLRVGRQPYGVLPITGRTPVFPGSTDDRRFWVILDHARRFWDDPTVQVPKLGNLHDARTAAEQLLAIIGQGPVPDPDAYELRTITTKATTQVQQDVGLDLTDHPAAHDNPAAPAIEAFLQRFDREFGLGAPLVRRIADHDSPTVGKAADPVFAELTASQLSQLWEAYAAPGPVPFEPRDLLGQLARRSLALATLRDQGKAHSEEPSFVLYGADSGEGTTDESPDEREDADDDTTSGMDVAAIDPIDVGAVNEPIIGSHLGPHTRRAWTGLGALVDQLPTMTEDDLVRLTGETLACTSTRLDAWITSLATRRLDELRTAIPSGTHLGYWGVLCDVPPPGEVPVNVGATLAPSVEQARTAAVLRAAELQHGGAGDTLADIDLTSRRARTARDVLESVGAGMPLASVLGVRLEQGLYAAGLAEWIAPLRELFPQRRTAGAVGEIYEGPTVPQEVVDGVDVVAAGGAVLQNGLVFADLPTLLRISRVIDDVKEVADAVADALVAEGVHHLAADRVDRAGATFEALANGSQLPYDLDVLRTPVTGTATSHRIFVAELPEVVGWDSAAWRAKLAPVAERFAQQVIGPPGQLAGHGLCALDVVAAGNPRPGESSPGVPSPVEAALGGPPVDGAAYAHQLALAGAAHAVLAGARPALTADIAAPPPPDENGHVRSWPPPGDLTDWTDLVTGMTSGDPRHPLNAAVEAERSPGEAGTPESLLDDWVRHCRIERLVSVARRAGGDACVPTFECASPAPATTADQDSIRSWLADHGRVRDAAAAVDDALLFTDLEGRHLPLSDVEVTQAKVHGVIVGPSSGWETTGALVVEDFLGVIPDERARLGLAMRYDAPNSRPPQTVLLAVHPDFSGRTPWTVANLEDVVKEAVELARIRIVELEDLHGTGADRMLPFALIRDGQVPIPDLRRV